MKLLKRAYFAASTVCLCLVVAQFIDDVYWKAVACSAIVGILCVFFIVEWVSIKVDKEFVSWYLTKLIGKMELHLTKDEISDILKHMMKVPGSFSDNEKFLKCLMVYIEEYVDPDKQEYFANAVLTARESIDFSDYEHFSLGLINQKKRIKVKEALIFSFEETVHAGLNLTNDKEIKRWKVYWLFCIPMVYVFVVITSMVAPDLSCFVDYTYLLLSLLFIIALDYYTSRKKIRALVYTFMSWCLHWIITMAFPQYITGAVFGEEKTFVLFHLNYLIMSIMGIRLINRLWTETEMEKNQDVSIENNKWLEVFMVKVIRLIRIPSLWIAFSFAIVGTIIMYTFVYSECLYLGSYKHCLYLSIATYFCGPESFGESIYCNYYLSETVIAFFLNTLYLANIVQLILEPKIKKE